MMRYIDDVDLEGKKVLLRTDLNMPIENGEPQETIRFEQYQKTVQQLSEQGAKVLIVAHQGRPGRKDFTSLRKHAKILSKHANTEVELINQFFTSKVEKKMERMKEGDVALLENVRFLSEELNNFSPEKHSESIFVQRVAPNFDLFVNDAFSAAHRSHASLVGFNQVLEDYAGPLMQREIENCQRVLEEFENGILVLGGEKPVDIISMMEEEIEEADKVLLGGIPGEAALIAQGTKLDKKEEFIENHSIDLKKEKLQKLLEEYSDKIYVPKDLKTDSGNHKVEDLPSSEMTWDIGDETIEEYKRVISDAKNVLMKGPMGAFDQGYEKGTKEIVDAIAENKEAFTVLGGGHTSSLVERFGHSLDDFDHVSIAGGAFVRYMSNQELPAIKALRQE